MKKLISVCLCLALSVSIGASALAAKLENVSVTLNRQISVTYDGVKQGFSDVNGTAVYPITYNGTTYLPVRAMSALVGLKIEYNSKTNTVELTSGGEKKSSPATSAAGKSETISAQLNSELKVTYDGKTQSFTDATGKTVYPITYNGTTYLPVRAISNLLDLPVDWDQASQTVVLGKGGGASSGVSASLFDFQVSIGGTVISFPAEMSALASLGYQLPEDKREYVLNPKTTTGGHVVDGSGNKIFGSVYNLSGSAVKMSQGKFTNASFKSTNLKDASDIVFAGDMKIGVSTIADVTAAFGEPSKKRDNTTAAGAKWDYYKYLDPADPTHSYVEFGFKNGVLDTVELYADET